MKTDPRLSKNGLSGATINDKSGHTVYGVYFQSGYLKVMRGNLNIVNNKYFISGVLLRKVDTPLTHSPTINVRRQRVEHFFETFAELEAYLRSYYASVVDNVLNKIQNQL